MTLSTDIYLHDPIDGREVFDFCRELLGAGPDITFTERGDSISNDPDQGLNAWLYVYRVDGAMVQSDPMFHWEDCAGTCEGGHHFPPPHWVRVNFDTAYGYRGASGEGCGELHASLIAQLGQWLDAKSVRWSWENEFTGEIHQGYDDLKGLARGGKEATAWFESIVAPAIEAMGGRVER